jgi:hypothetical protein
MQALDCANSAGLRVPQTAVTVRAPYKDFRKLVAYVLADDPALDIKVVQQMGYFGLKLKAGLGDTASFD